MAATQNPRTRVAIVENHAITRHGLEALLAEADDLEVAWSGDDVQPLLTRMDRLAEIVILDLRLGREDIDSTEAIAPLVARHYQVLVHTNEERPARLRRVIAAGARGVTLKNDDNESLLSAVRQALVHDFVCSSELASALVHDPALLAQLTDRERDVLDALRDGFTRAQAARRIGMQPGTLKTHLDSVRRKYVALGREVTNTGSLIREADADGWLA